MLRPFKLLAALGVVTTTFGVPGTTVFSAPGAYAASEQQELVERARLTVEDLRKDKAFGNAQQLLRRARAVLIVPRLYKGGFFVGGEGGSGVLLSHTAASGTWSAPAFYGIGSASFGLQIGVQESEMVLIVMSQKALDALLTNQFKIGANAAISVVTLGSSVEGATTSAVGPDIVVWASSSGAYAGLTLNGSIIQPQTKDDRAFYGRAVTTRDILNGRGAGGNQAAGLRETLSAAAR